MIASLKDNTFTGIAYNDLSPSQRKWHDEVGLEWMYVDNRPKTGSQPSEHQLSFHILKLRDEKIEEMTWRIERYSQQLLALPTTDDSAEWFEAAVLYVQQLRDINKQDGFPFEFTWPNKPS